jgi:hypothetical protein
VPRKNHGGARPGAGRPPKALRYAHEVAAQEAKLVAALPQMLDLILAAARAGDTSAARYVVDRVLGRVQTQAAPIAEDYSLPSDHPGAAAHAEVCRRRRLALELQTPTAGPRADAIRTTEHMLVDAELTALPEDERLDAQEAHMARKRGGRPRLDALNSCIVTKPAEEPEGEIAAQLPGPRPRTTPSSAPASPARPSGGGGGEVEEHEFEAALARLAEYAAGGVPSARTDVGRKVAEIGT